MISHHRDTEAQRLWRRTGPTRIEERQMMAAITAKDKALGAVQALPADATIEEIMERLYFLAKVERGLAEADAGKTVPHEEAKRRLIG